MNLREFIASKHTNLWISEPGLEYYVRKSLMFEGAIELASCHAPPDSAEFGFWKFIRRYSREVPFVVEQVFNPGIVNFLRKLRWLERDIGGVPQFASPLLAQRYEQNKYFKAFYLK